MGDVFDLQDENAAQVVEDLRVAFCAAASRTYQA
jgi:hypothetical protein